MATQTNWFTTLIIVLFAVSIATVPCCDSAQDFDFFYFVLQWPGSYCDTKQSCCYPTTGKPAADFGIHGLWPNFRDGSYPSICDSGNPFDPSQISNLTSQMKMSWPSLACPSSNGQSFWSHEWDKHGTCSESALDQHSYFQAALSLKNRVNILASLRNAGIDPDDGFYSLSSISSAIRSGSGTDHTPGVECNKDSEGNPQLYQIQLCVDKSGEDLIDCPVFPNGSCSSQVQFPSF